MEPEKIEELLISALAQNYVLVTNFCYIESKVDQILKASFPDFLKDLEHAKQLIGMRLIENSLLQDYGDPVLNERIHKRVLEIGLTFFS